MNLNPAKSLVVESLESNDNANVEIESNERKCETVSIRAPPGLVNEDFDGIEVVGSCNGLICLFANLDERLGRFYLWNPTLGEYWVSKWYEKIGEWSYARDFYKKMGPRNFMNCNLYSVFGFGYDAKCCDYKIVWLICDSEKKEMEVNVYTVGSGTWRTVGYFPLGRSLKVKESSVFASGALHWYLELFGGGNGDDNCVISFDLEKEEFREAISLPDLGTWNLSAESFVVIGGKLTFYGRPNLIEYVDNQPVFSFGHSALWLMEEYGVKASWTKKESYSRDGWATSLLPGERWTLVPLCFTRNGNVLFDEYDDYVTLYDAGQKTCSKVNPGDWDKQLLRIPYLETLVTPFNPQPKS